MLSQFSTCGSRVILAWETSRGAAGLRASFFDPITSPLATVGELLACSLRGCGCSCPFRVVISLLYRSDRISQVLVERYKRPLESELRMLKMSR